MSPLRDRGPNWPSVLSAFGICLAATSAVAQAPSPDAPSGGAEAAACALDLRLPSAIYYRGPYGRGYGISDQVRHQEQFQAQVEHRGAPCDYVLVVSSSHGGGSPRLIGAGGGLTYDIKGAGGGRNLASDNDEGDGGNRIAGRFQQGPSSASEPFYVEVSPGQAVRFGRYDDLIQFRLFKDDAGQLSLVDEGALGISVDVPASVQASIGDTLGSAGGAQSATVDLGELKSGARQDLSFTVVANADLTVAFKSLNQGLRHGPSDAVIPYTVSLNGRRMALDGSQEFDLQAGLSQPLRQSFRLEVGEVANRAPAGVYSDALQLTLSAR